MAKKCDGAIKENEKQTKKLFKKSLSKRYEDTVDRFFEKVEEKFDKVGEKVPLVRDVIIPKEVKEVADMIGAYRQDTVEMARNAAKISDFLVENLTEEESVALTRALGGDGEIPEHLKPVYDRFRKIIDANADALVREGALDEKYKIKDYLKRYYKQYLEERKVFSVKMSKVFRRKDLTHEERLEIGLVENADFVVANTILEQKKQLKKARLLKQIADTFAIDEPRDGYRRVSDETVGGGIYKYGALAGKYLPEKVYRELVGARMVGDALAILDRSLWTEIIDHIKVNVTVKNPGTHLYNVLSNVSLAYLNGDLIPLVQVLKMAVTDRKKFAKLVKLSRKFGLNTELHEYERLHNSLDVRKDSNILKSFLKNLYMAEGTKTGDAIRRVYSAEDEIFKLASFYKRIKGRKLSTESARREFKEAMADYVDYSTPLPRIVRWVDRNGLFPFMHYVWKSTPRVAKIIAKNPVKYTLLQVALLEMGASVFTDDDNLQKPEWAQDHGFAGLIKYLPSNLYAAKQYVQIGDSDTFINLGRALPGMRLGDMSFDGGFLSSILNLWEGKDPRGRDYVKKDDSLMTKWVKGLAKTAESFGPSLTIGRYAQRFGKKALGIDPAKNDYGVEQDWNEIVMRIFGVWKFDREKHVEQAIMKTIKEGAEAGKSKEEIQKDLKEILDFAKRKGLRTPATKVKKKIRKDLTYRNDKGKLYKKIQSEIRAIRGSSPEKIRAKIKPFLLEAKRNGIELDTKMKKSLKKYIRRYSKYYE